VFAAERVQEMVAEAKPVLEGATGTAEHVHEISGMSVDTVCQDSGEEATQRHKTSRSQEQIDFRKLEAIKRRKKMDYLRPLQKDHHAYRKREDHIDVVLQV